MNPESGMTFSVWYAAVDKVIMRKLGIGVDDGADFNSYDTWSGGGSVMDGVEAWVEEQGMLDLVDLLDS